MDKVEASDMEGESKTDEPCIKIETVWSQTEENLEYIKEENISDVEAENVNEESSANYECFLGSNVDNNEDPRDNEEGGGNDDEPEAAEDDDSRGSVEDASSALSQLRERRRTVRLRAFDDEGSPVCLHDAKKFKVIKKRLRCTDCHSILCSECFCTISSSVQNHFSKSDNNSSTLYPCKLCSMIFKSNCALQAHIRVHLLETPYVCPDCGVVYNNIYYLSLHIINKCYHVYKVVTNGCKFCLSRDIAPGEYLSHIEKCHIKPVCKCSSCGAVFESTREINRHFASSHKNEKVFCLSYFCCLMCGNLVISKHLYAKHIKFHQEHSAAFEVNYICQCTQSFNTASSFRTHLKTCSERGNLPPQWMYLTAAIGEQEEEEDGEPVATEDNPPAESSASDGKGESTTEKGPVESIVFEQGAGSEGLAAVQSGSTTKKGGARRSGAPAKTADQGKRNTKSGKKGTAKSRKGGKAKGKSVEESNITSGIYTIIDADCGMTDESNFAWALQGDTTHIIREVNLDTAEIITERSGLIPNVQLVEEYSQEPLDDGNGCPEESESVTQAADVIDISGERSVNAVYDHIPCDHLGYLKRNQFQELEGTRNDGQTNDSAGNEEGTVEDEDYIITTVLDEKTGMMKTKKVLLQITQEEEVESGIEQVNTSPSQEAATINPKSGYFRCPFCTVLFPKHFTSFQKVRLHLQSYHPEAALDISVDRTEVPKSQTQFTTIRKSVGGESNEESDDLDNIDLQTRLNESLKRSNRKEGALRKSREIEKEAEAIGPAEKRRKGDESGKQKVIEMELRSVKAPESKQQVAPRIVTTSRKSTFARRISDGSRVMQKPLPSLQSPSTSMVTAPPPSQNLNRRTSTLGDSGMTVPSTRHAGKGSPQTRKEETCGTSSGKGKALHSVEFTGMATRGRLSTSIECNMREKVDAKNKPTKTLLKKVPPKGRRSEASLPTGSKAVSETKTSSGSNEGNEATGTSGPEIPASRPIRGKASQKNPRMPRVEIQEYQIVECASDVIDSEVLTLRRRSEDLGSSRPESDVWSDFYKTLKVAETPKSRVKNRESENKMSEPVKTQGPSILAGYTKRVVKKPKRYRESSDSGESRTEKLPGGESKGVQDPVAHDDIYTKKKKLISRIESVDNRLVDYIIDLIDSKEKSSPAAKKPGETSTRATRKRTSTAGRGGGRQKTNPSGSNEQCEQSVVSSQRGEKEPRDVNSGVRGGETQTTTEEKSTDKKRGRPRSVRERRKSDFDREVSFIEKNFEADEGEVVTNKRKRKLSSKLQYYKRMSALTDKHDFSSGQVISSKSSDLEKKFTCAVCKENHPSETEFREHIQSHRMDDNSHQCMECGECFVVRPSLEKHLHAFHKIKDVNKYIEENQCSTVEKNEVEVEAEPLKENQCRVCRDEFGSVKDLNKHFRIHGMAFLKQYRREK